MTYEPIDLTGHVAIVTGAGAGLGRAHVKALASRGARIAINDLNAQAAAELRDEVVAAGGEAVVQRADVMNQDEVRSMVADITARWGKVDILVNNAGILRDKTFARMDPADFRLVLDVHLMGSVYLTKAVWDGMRERRYGRILFTTSSSGLYGNFGQANYGAAKMALVGLMQTLALEGERYDIRVNCLAPSAATAMTNGLYAEEALAGLGPDLVSPAVLALAGPNAPTRRIVLAGAGNFEQANITMTRGIYLGAGPTVADDLLSRWSEVADRDGEMVPASGVFQNQFELERAAAARQERLAAE